MWAKAEAGAEQRVKLTMLALFALLQLCYGAGDIHGAMVHGYNYTDMVSLLDFKKAITDDPYGALGSWNTSNPLCRWKGVTCSPKHPERVTVLDLAGQSLVGPISSSLGNLTLLKILNLSSNSFSSQLPPLNHLHTLQVLDLGTNLLHDIIPDALTNCSKLRIVDLHRNFLVGEIPLQVGLLSNLSVLRLSQNNLTGIIPPTISNITRIEIIALSHNQLTGSIPEDLGKLSKTYFLALGGNYLLGGFPQGLFNMSNSLQVLALEFNKLHSALPTNIGDALPNLQLLLLNNNMFEGHIPASLGNSSGLEFLQLENNNFTGEIPSSFGKLRNLSHLNLQENKLKASDSKSWEFFYALTNCSLLEKLSLARNQLHGYIPNSIGNLSASLQMLLLGGNELSGIVPPSIGNLGGLTNLTLDDNNLSGTIEWIGKLTKLKGLFLQGNNFVGPIP